MNEGKHLDISMVWENAKYSILQFLKWYTDYVNTYNILPYDIWNLDEAGFKIEDSTTCIQYLIT